MVKTEIFDDDKETSKEIVEMLGRYIQSGNINILVGSGASQPAIDLAGTIEKDIDEKLEAKEYDEANKIALKFIEKLEAQQSSSTGQCTSNEKDNQKKTLDNYVKFLKELDRILFERKNVLLPRQANIFTTNYDMFLESASAELPSLALNDGFNRKVGVSNFKFSPELLFDRLYRAGTVYEHQSEVPTVNLIKLHGSVTWEREKNEHILFRTKCASPLTDKTNKSAVKEELAKRAVILPNMRKFESTLLDRVYFDLLRLYSNAMEKENALLLVFGFSFNDEHILDITRRSLRNPTAKLIIFAHSKKDIKKYKGKFGTQRNVLIIGPKENKFIELPEINSIFAQIGSKIESSDD